MDRSGNDRPLKPLVLLLGPLHFGPLQEKSSPAPTNMVHHHLPDYIPYDKGSRYHQKDAHATYTHTRHNSVSSSR